MSERKRFKCSGVSTHTQTRYLWCNILYVDLLDDVPERLFHACMMSAVLVNCWLWKSCCMTVISFSVWEG